MIDPINDWANVLIRIAPPDQWGTVLFAAFVLNILGVLAMPRIDGLGN